MTDRRDPQAVERRHRRARTPRRAVALVAAMLVVVGLVPAPPAQAGLLSGALGLASTTVDVADEVVVDGVVGGTTEALLDLGLLRSLVTWRHDATTTELDHVARVIGASGLRRAGHRGDGVGVALIDTGVVGVEGLPAATVHNGPDLSFEGAVDELRYLDAFGHGTHMAGIINGWDSQGFSGIAPRADLVSLRAATGDGAVDVSQVIAAIDWVVANREHHDIRVINLSYGTASRQDYRLDPLAAAVEHAWRHGIVVVAAGGNDGDSPLNNPAISPFVLAVGAADTRGTITTLDDTVPSFSSRGTRARRVDVVAPGRSIVSLRVPGSLADTAYPDARVGERFFKGSGSSQAAAVVSGAVALLLDARPELSPDQVKHLLMSTASPMPLADRAGRGAGMIDVAAAAASPAPQITQPWEPATGLGSLEAARGGQHVADEGVELTGERDVLGPWDAADWADRSAEGTAWTGGAWLDRPWIGDCWCASTWAGSAWEGRSWTGASWTGRSWTGRSWTGRSWTGRSWTGASWTGRSWTGASWTGRSWTGRSWTAAG